MTTMRHRVHGAVAEVLHRTIARVVLLAAFSFFATTTAFADAPPAPSVLERIVELNPHLKDADPRGLPMKLRSIRETPYEFFRGTADLYYHWCKAHCTDWLDDAGSNVLLHGDVHPGNTGTFRSPGENGDIHFSLVDLDEAFHGPFQFDLLRAAVSLQFAAGEADLTLTPEELRTITNLMCEEYARALTGGVGDRELSAGYKTVRKLVKKAADEDAAEYFGNYVFDGDRPRLRRIVLKKGQASDLLDPVDARTRESILAALWRGHFDGPQAASRRAAIGCRSEEDFGGAVLDIAEWTRLSSAGSQGLSKFIVLLRLDQKTNGSPHLLLQLKEEPACAAERASLIPAEKNADRGEFVARAHLALQCHRSDWIGSVNIGGRSYLIRPKSPFAKEPSRKDVNKPAELRDMSRLLGGLLGRGHAAGIGNDAARCQRIAGLARALPPVLALRCREVHDQFVKDHRSLCEDRRFKDMAERADAYLNRRINDGDKRAAND